MDPNIQHQQFASRNGAGGQHNSRHSMADVRALSDGPAPTQNGHSPMPVPAAGNGFAGHQHRASAMSGAGGIGFSRSPPSNKNTAHVPCKFFRAGSCQAGSACPFSHALDAINEPTPCKYFAKGNCKFGAKCANPHILPDGRDGRKFNWRTPFGSGAAQFGNRIRAPSNPHYVDPTALSTYNAGGPTPTSPTMYQAALADEYYQSHGQSRLDDFSGAGAAYPSMSISNYGSPPRESRLGMSPPIRALDATLPASFDSQGISHVAKFGPAGASVPNTFGLGLLTSTSPTTSGTTSTFGNLNYIANNNTNGSARQSASSPPAAIIDGFPRRILHSELRSNPQMITSSSMPGPRPIARHEYFADDSDGSDDELLRLPGALTDDLLTPSEKARRISRADEDHSGFGTRQSLSGFGSPSDSKGGSPSNASPSSRYGALFARRQREDNTSVDMSASPSAFGHVGSPLRKLSLQADGTGPGASMLRPTEASSSPFDMPSPPLMRTSGGVGMLSQQLRGTRLSSNTSLHNEIVTDPMSNVYHSNLHPSSATSATRSRPANSSSLAAALNGNGAGGINGRLDRTVSSSSIGRGHERIDEEFLFSMEEDEGGKKEREKEKEKEDQIPQKLATPWSQIAAKGAGTGASAKTKKTKATAGGTLGPIGRGRGHRIDG